VPAGALDRLVQETGSPMSSDAVVVDGRELRLSNLDKLLWPDRDGAAGGASGFTKGQMIDYYHRIAPVMVPHLTGRPVTLRRWPDGVDHGSFFEKNCPSHRPAWMSTVTLGDVAYCSLDEPAALVWTANLAAIELHPTLARAPSLDAPTAVVFDLDPGAPADILTCARVALLLRDILDRLSLTGVVKTSGSKGLQLYVPIAPDTGYLASRTFSHLLSRLIERSYPDLVVTTQDRSVRAGKVLIDWSQNSASKTTVAVYSLRAWETPSVSTPLRWGELEAAVAAEDRGALRFTPDQVLERVAAYGDLMAAALRDGPALPKLGGSELQS
jgi:bifunctional non-homologous end joining protein LigD